LGADVANMLVGALRRGASTFEPIVGAEKANRLTAR